MSVANTLIPKRPTAKPKHSATAWPELIVFDVDGVLVDVRGSFHLTTLQTVRFFTGQRVTSAELQQWKNRSGFNDDWKLSTAWVQSLGGKAEYEEVKAKFVELYWGDNGKGNVLREKWLLPRPMLRRLAKQSQLALFTGRTRKELDYTLDLCKVRSFFPHIVTVEDVARPKPDPEGLLKILGTRDPTRALYIGDSVDDALAAQSARIPFLGVLFGRGTARRERARLLQERGALAVMDSAGSVESWLDRHRSKLTTLR